MPTPAGKSRRVQAMNGKGLALLRQRQLWLPCVQSDKGEWVIDEEAAAVVRRIFHSVVAGESIASIARALRAEKIPIPSEHWKRIGAPVRAAKYTDPYAWSTTTISYILKRPEYTGRKVLGKTVCENYKTKSTRKTAPEEQYIFDGEIPAIVDEETWNTVQRLMGQNAAPPSGRPPQTA